VDRWLPIKGDVCRPKYTAIEGSYFVRVVSFEDNVVTFCQIKQGRPVGVHTNYLSTFLHRFELTQRNNVVCIASLRKHKAESELKTQSVTL